MLDHHGYDLYFWSPWPQSHPRHRRPVPSDGKDCAGVDQQRVSYPLDVRAVRVAEDDDVRCRMELCQTAAGTSVESVFVRQPQMVAEHEQDLEAKANWPWPVAVGEHDVLSGQLQFDYLGQRRAAIGEVYHVEVAAHGVNRRDGSQRLQRRRIVHVAGVQDHVHPGQRVERCLRQPLQAVRDVSVGKETNNKVGHLIAV
jgi:hypothetical protein